MGDDSQTILDILSKLVACDTQNPPRDIGIDHPIWPVIRQCLPDDLNCSVADHGRGRVSLLARRGRPRVLFQVHLDTVPAGAGWSTPPLQLTVVGQRAFGRGTCDVKGAAACLIAAFAKARGDLAILFTTDEEGSESCCVTEFCHSGELEPFECVVVAEPTRCRAVSGHRGYLSVSGQFAGGGGHTSDAGRLSESANHRALGWGATALKIAAEFERSELDGQSCCFNVGRIDGGIKNNMVADSCHLSWSARVPPGRDQQQLLTRLTQDKAFVHWQTRFAGNPLPADRRQLECVNRWIADCDLAAGDPVDFWTEASIFSSFGKPAIVLGPGDIVQAHAPDEWVDVRQLDLAVQAYARINKYAGDIAK